MQGYLKKQSPTLGDEMQNRFFRLDGNMLSYFKDERDRDPKGVISIRWVSLSELSKVYVAGWTI